MSFPCQKCRKDISLGSLAELPCNCLVCVPCSRGAVVDHLQRLATDVAPSPQPSAVKRLRVQLEPGDEVYYRKPDGSYVKATVEIVDISVQPPQYGIQLANTDNLRFTEEDRLFTELPAPTPPPRQPPSHLPTARCPCCSSHLALQHLRALAPEAVAAWEAERTASWLRVHDVIACPHPRCGALIQRVPAAGNAGADPRSPLSPLHAHMREQQSPPRLQRQQRQRQQQQQDKPKQQLSDAEAHRELHRFRCGACGKDFCDACGAAPYHNGLTCGQARAPDCLLCRGKVEEERLAQLLPVAAAKEAREHQGRPAGSQHGAAAGAGPGQAKRAEKEVAAAVVQRASKSELLSALKGLGLDISWCLERRDLEQAFLHWGCLTCGAPDCAAKRRAMCARPLPCGHWCCGLRGEGDNMGAAGAECRHPRCVECGADPAVPSPSSAAAAGGSAAALPMVSDCCFCWEPLSTAPCIEMKCGVRHVCHLHCAQARLAAGYPGPHISFAHLSCPLCRDGGGGGGAGAQAGGGSGASSSSGVVQASLAPVHLSHPALSACLAPHLQLREALVAAVRERLRMDPLLRAAPELQPGGRYDGRPVDFGVERLLFYKCSKCSKPYYGGQRACGAAAAGEAAQQQQAAAGGAAAGGAAGGGGGDAGAAAGGGGAADQQLVCGDCCAVAAGTSCGQHGTSYIEWKCKYCCSLASWFCFGTTHFCDPCHRDYCARKLLGFKPTPGSACVDPNCAFKHVPHPPPGQEACLGCGMCRNR
ncbi:hypothetical protein Agub_g12352 [Astrephomene gubernaculifera]|uniref:IBR domain-containing protein n=1 Tax=Astrephomene gubernaculifera TaxID=47775 RepID=A0AAD3E0U5_9CHLO|nr:hypothetical protein Agub_g12352 [Astrephomene gubernaculifera]